MKFHETKKRSYTSAKKQANIFIAKQNNFFLKKNHTHIHSEQGVINN